MISSVTAYTQEIDDIEIAVSEILEQINLSKLGKNSIGILTCYPEFIDTGVVKALSDKLPFDVVGCTTLASATNGNNGLLELTLMVLTGDDVDFAAAVSSGISDERDKPLREMYRGARAKLNMNPVFMLAFMPLIYSISGEVLLNILDDESKLPIFGTMAVDHTRDYHMSKTIYNGDVYEDSVSIVLIGGNVNPKFFIASVSEENTVKQNAIITNSDGNILKEVNGLPAIKYFESLGVAKNGQFEGYSTTPLVVDFNDGTKPVIRAVFAQSPEGYIVCGGSIPINSTLSIGSLNYQDVIETSRQMSNEILSLENAGALILFSCIGRNYALGVKSKDEMNGIEDIIGTKIPYHLAYSGGEVCPLRDNDSNLKNRFHNDTIVACVL